MDWRSAYHDLFEEHQHLRRTLDEAAADSASNIRMLEEAKAGLERVFRLSEEVEALRDALQVLCRLHEREYRDGTHWCRECLYQWPCRTLHVINQIRNVYGW